jgi:hypothetical protein
MRSPTDTNQIRSDSQGSGKYGARRKSRIHLGEDFIWKDFDVHNMVYMPIDGKIVRISKPFANKELFGVFIQGRRMALNLFYFNVIPRLIDYRVAEGEVIGYGQDLREHYGPEMTPHIHLQVESYQYSLFLKENND